MARVRAQRGGRRDLDHAARVEDRDPIAARSAERLALLGDALTDPASADLYRGLATAEVRHRDTFLDLAADVDPTGWHARLATLAAAESALIARLPVRARIH